MKNLAGVHLLSSNSGLPVVPFMEKITDYNDQSPFLNYLNINGNGSDMKNLYT